MRFNEVQIAVLEREVDSSWIADLHYTGQNILMTLNSGRTYTILNVPEVVYDAWVAAQSKGKFWHQNIKDTYRVR